MYGSFTDHPDQSDGWPWSMSHSTLSVYNRFYYISGKMHHSCVFKSIIILTSLSILSLTWVLKCYLCMSTHIYAALETQVYRISTTSSIHRTFLVPPWNNCALCRNRNLIPMSFHVQISCDPEIHIKTLRASDIRFSIFTFKSPLI